MMVMNSAVETGQIIVGGHSLTENCPGFQNRQKSQTLPPNQKEPNKKFSETTTRSGIGSQLSIL